ncbi:MAG: hypothetical protein HQK83_19435 [Fibrobacteria bacterium]|nr:hypothetical protein [Fibrobacteria bacterium]
MKERHLSVLTTVLALILCISMSEAQVNYMGSGFPKNGMIMIDAQGTKSFTGKFIPKTNETKWDEALHFEELIDVGINGVILRTGISNDYTWPEWIMMAHEYGMWVCRAIGPGADFISTTANSSAMGVDFQEVDEPLKGWTGAAVCPSWSAEKPFSESIYINAKDAAAAVNPDCKIIITDVDCNQNFIDWNVNEGLLQEVYSNTHLSKYLPQAVTHKNKYPNRFTGVWTWILEEDEVTKEQLPESDINKWFDASWDATQNVLLFIFNYRGATYGTNWPKRAAHIKAKTGKSSPVPVWQNFGPVTVAGSAPDCQVQVKSAVGMDPASVECYYAIHQGDVNNTKWIRYDDFTVTGTKGTTDWVTITANRVPFNQVSSELNKVMFKIKDTYSGNYFRNERKFHREYVVNVNALDWTEFGPDSVVNTLNPDMSIKVQSAAGIDVSSVVCEYTVDGGKTWEKHQATCSGTNGSTSKEMVTAEAVPFTSDLGKMNKIRFSIKTSSGDELKSAEYTVKVELPPVYSGLTLDRTADDAVDLTVNIQEPAGLRVGSYETEVRDETVALLHLDENFDDASGNGYNGKYYGNGGWKDTETWKSSGGTEKMLYFDGAGDFADFGYGWLGKSRDITVSAWVKAESEGFAVSLGGPNYSAQSIVIELKSTYVRVVGRDLFNGRHYMETMGGTFSQNEWHHVAFTWYDAIKTGFVYIDGNAEAGMKWGTSGWLCDKFMPLRLGLAADTSMFYKGYVDEVHVLSRALSAEEMAAEYYSGMYRYKNEANPYFSKWEKLDLDVEDRAKTKGIATVTGAPFVNDKDTLGVLQFAARDLNGNAGVQDYTLLKDDAVNVKNTITQQTAVRLFPNPFRIKTNIQFGLQARQNVSVDVYGIDGKRVRHLFDGVLSSGNQSIAWNGTDDKGLELSAGRYFARVKIGHYVTIKNIMMMR